MIMLLHRNCHFRLLLILAFPVLTSASQAQTHLSIHTTGGNHTDVPIAQIDSITFVDGDINPDIADLTGCWMWGNVEQGYYELLTFNNDHTYTGYDNYFMYGLDMMTYGRYRRWGAMLTLQSNGFGYQRRSNWLVIGLTDNALDVMTKMGPFTYFRLQPEVITLQVEGEPFACSDGDSYVFTDGMTVKITDNKLKGVTKGVTYIQKYIATKNVIVAYKVIVE